MKEGAWINEKTGEFAWITEHASWIKKKENADKIGLSPRAYDNLKDLKWDFDGEGREAILLVAMNAGLIRMRGHGSYWTFEFTIETQAALWACLGFLDDFAGPLTQCRFNNLRTKEQIEMPYREFKASMTEDPETVMRIASVIHDPEGRTAAFSIDAAASASRQKLLATKYQVPEWFVGETAHADPTSNGTYTEWLTKLFKPLCYSPNGEMLSEAPENLYDRLELATKLLTEYGRLKNSAEWVRARTQERGKDAANIMSYRTFEEFQQVVSSATTEDLSRNEQERELQRRRQEYLDEGCDLLGAPQIGYTCWHPQTVQAVKLMSKGSHWCTQGSYADSYFRSGELYVFATDDPETSDKYGSDRFAQLYVASDGDKIEIQDVDGDDLYEEEFGGRAWAITSDAWWMVEFVAQHDKTLAGLIKSNLVHEEGAEGPNFTQCAQCEDYMDDDSTAAVYIENDPSSEYDDSVTFCSSSCFDSYFEEYRKETVEKLMEGRIETPDADAATAEWDEMRDNPESIQDPALRKVMEAFNAAILTNNIRHAKTGDLLTDYDIGWALTNIRTIDNMRRSRIQNGKPMEEIKAELDAKINKVMPGCGMDDYEYVDPILTTLHDRIREADRQMDDIQEYVEDNFDQNDNMDIKKILQRGGYLPKGGSFGVEHRLQSSLLRQAKAIALDDRFLDTFMGMVGSLLRDRVYGYGEDDQKLKDITRRDSSWQIDESDWKEQGIQFVRADDEVLNRLLVVIKCDPNKVPSGTAKPVIFAGSLYSPHDPDETPVMTLWVNGNLTKAEAIAQFNPQNPEYHNVRTAIKHEFTHLYDRAQTREEAGLSEDMLEDDDIYFNQSREVRAWTGNLLDEFHQYDGDVDAFLKESRVWGIVSQHLNAQNRQSVLKELGRASHAKVDHRGPVGR